MFRPSGVMRVGKAASSVIDHIAPCKRSRKASTTGVGTSTASALAWIASMCGWRYESEARAYGAGNAVG
jgi:hypothetical protein